MLKIRPSLKIVFLVLLSGVTIQAAQMIIGQNMSVARWFAPNSDHWTGTYKNVTGADPMKPEFIDECTPYHILRFHNWVHTNDHYGDRGSTGGFIVHGEGWTDRKKKNDPDQSLVAYEWMIYLCNRTNAHLWLPVVHKATEDYWLKLGIFIKTGVDMLDKDLTSIKNNLVNMTAADFVAAGGIQTGEALNTNLKWYFEYANENWLGADRHQYTIDMGKKLGLTPLVGNGDDQIGFTYEGYIIVKIRQALDLVFGKNSPRLMCMVAGQAGNPYVASVEMAAAMSDKYNPDKTRIDGLAPATYFDGNSPSSQKDRWVSHKTIADKYNVGLYFYEGGSGTAGPTTSSSVVTTYNAWLKMMEDIGFIGGCHHHHVGGNEWATIPSTGIGKEAAMKYAKYKALVDYCAKMTKSMPEPVGLRPVDRNAHSFRPSSLMTNNTFAIHNLAGRRINGNNHVAPKSNGLYIYITDGRIVYRR